MGTGTMLATPEFVQEVPCITLLPWPEGTNLKLKRYDRVRQRYEFWLTHPHIPDGAEFITASFVSDADGDIEFAGWGF